MVSVWPRLEKSKDLGRRKKHGPSVARTNKPKDLVDAKGIEIGQYPVWRGRDGLALSSNCFVVEFPSFSF
ncbi:unnamed protein product [Prunus armeniaca]|uniref:Uncharacterized protein n=1 Tax=Prunus armeniaca TaxID=36596 RepID=A0A6J5Y4X5_PRUAR|nr:unnamed protein product [Prunus armeniaca]CAB4289111.1 unnamed protein product [Prunus armeniaca]CAB4319473.1 unnamed protein product [Prunus armeniaca]